MPSIAHEREKAKLTQRKRTRSRSISVESLPKDSSLRLLIQRFRKGNKKRRGLFRWLPLSRRDGHADSNQWEFEYCAPDTWKTRIDTERSTKSSERTDEQPQEEQTSIPKVGYYVSPQGQTFQLPGDVEEDYFNPDGVISKTSERAMDFISGESHEPDEWYDAAAPTESSEHVASDVLDDSSSDQGDLRRYESAATSADDDGSPPDRISSTGSVVRRGSPLVPKKLRIPKSHPINL